MNVPFRLRAFRRYRLTSRPYLRLLRQLSFCFGYDGALPVGRHALRLMGHQLAWRLRDSYADRARLFGLGMKPVIHHKGQPAKVRQMTLHTLITCDDQDKDDGCENREHRRHRLTQEDPYSNRKHVERARCSDWRQGALMHDPTLVPRSLHIPAYPSAPCVK